ncbi:MAG: TerB family tellurite resistance protein [Woeseiaceae bacterium]
MLNKIKQFFEQNISLETEVDIEHRLKLATAALMIEIMKQDGETKNEEVDAVKQALQTKFELTKIEIDELFTLASEEAKQSVDLYQFTSLIREHFSTEKKIKTIEYLWTVAYADNHLDSHEEHLIRRIADLLYVTHQDFIKAKLKVQENLK